LLVCQGLVAVLPSRRDPDTAYYVAYALLLIMGGGALSGTIHTIYAATISLA